MIRVLAKNNYLVDEYGIACFATWAGNDFVVEQSRDQDCVCLNPSGDVITSVTCFTTTAAAHAHDSVLQSDGPWPDRTAHPTHAGPA